MDLKQNNLSFDKDKINDVLSDISSKTCSKSNDISYCKICDPKCKYLDCICAESWKSFDETLQQIKNVSSEIFIRIIENIYYYIVF